MRLVLGQDGMQVLPTDDQDAVQELTAQGPGQALADRVLVVEYQQLSILRPVPSEHQDSKAEQPVN